MQEKYTIHVAWLEVSEKEPQPDLSSMTEKGFKSQEESNEFFGSLLDQGIVPVILWICETEYGI